MRDSHWVQKLLSQPMWLRLQTFSAWLLLLNGLSGIVVPLVIDLWSGKALDLPGLIAFTPLWGVAAGLLAVRGHLSGWFAGIGFYAIQTVSFFSPAFQFSFKSGLSLAAVFVLPHGVLVINWAAILLGALCGLVVWHRMRGVHSGRTGPIGAEDRQLGP